jgi:L-rhamnose isomerase/sugar isomerase
MLQTVTTALELWAKAALVDRETLAVHQQHCDLIDAENCLKDAFSSDVRPVIAEWAASKNLPADPLDAFRQSGYLERITKERSARNSSRKSSGYA